MRTVSLVLPLWLAGCGGGDWTIYGEPAEVDALLSRVQDLGEISTPPPSVPVVLEGTVGTVCDMGCWFYLLDESDMIYVKLDLASSFVIPPDAMGRKVIIEGTLRGDPPETLLKANTVLLYGS